MSNPAADDAVHGHGGASPSCCGGKIADSEFMPHEEEFAPSGGPLGGLNAD